MKNISLNKQLQLILLIRIISYTVQKVTYLKALNIENVQCDNESKNYSFQIKANLNGSLSQSMINKLTISVSSRYNLTINCTFPVSSTNSTENISIPCYINNSKNGNLTFKFINKNTNLKLLNFDENLLYLNIFCQKNITLYLLSVKESDSGCQQLDSYSNYVYKININNDTLPKDLNLSTINISPNISHDNIDDYNNNYNNTCTLIIKKNNNNYFLCEIKIDKLLEGTIFYEENYTYIHHTLNYDYTIIVNNLDNDLYVGENISCAFETKLDLLNIFKGNCKNGAFFFSIDFSYFRNGNKDMEIYSKLLYEIKSEKDPKINKNYCYLDNGNRDYEYDITKYKLNCVIPLLTNDNSDYNIIFENLYSKYFLLNYLIKKKIKN